MENEILVDVGTTLKPLDDGSFEILKDNKLVGKIANDIWSYSQRYWNFL